MENDEIRPEFDVLKPYFARILKSGKAEIDITAEFEDELLVVQTARSEALERINREIIESVKFRFLEGDIVNRQYQEGNTELIDIRTLQEGLDAEFYKSGESLLNDLNTMRNQGRNAFLNAQPVNFTRLTHDYTDQRKGFVSWKARLEERLV